MAARGRKLNQETKIREQLNILYDLIVLILMFIVMVLNKILVYLNSCLPRITGFERNQNKKISWPERLYYPVSALFNFLSFRKRSLLAF